MLRNVLLAILVFTGCMVSADYFACKQSFPSGTSTPDDELMNALYVADPDPDTGYMSFTANSWTDDITGVLVSSTVSYDTWLTREHEGKDTFTNLWSYLTRIIISNVYDIYSHYKVIDQVGDSRPRGVVDFSKLSTTFYNACFNFDSKKDTWPFSCFDANYFCALKYAIDAMKSVIFYSKWNFENGRWVVVTNMKSLNTINSMSYLGISTDERSYVLDYLFNSAVINFIPEKAQGDVFYHSRMVYESLRHLMSGKTEFDSWITNWRYVGFEDVEYKLNSKCTEQADAAVGQQYYCKGKVFAAKIRACAQLTDVTPCVYDPLIQDYFSKGRFGSIEEMNVLSNVISRTQTLLTAFKDKISGQDKNGLGTLLTTFNPYVTVDDSVCVIDWARTFDCTNNRGCYDSSNFDCSGGYTCRISTMYRFDCILKFVMKQVQTLVDLSGSWGSAEVIKAKNDVMIWLSYLPMGRYASLSSTDINNVILTTQRTLKDYVTSYDTSGLTTFVTNLPPVTFVPFWAKNAACQTTTLDTAYTIFCNLDPLLNSVFMFLDAFNKGSQSTTKSINPTEDYKITLEQLQLERIQNYIVLQTESYFGDISDQLQQNFGALSNYFSSLANYDKTKAEADIAYIDGRLTLFKNMVTALLQPVETMFKKVLYLSIGANVAELVQRTAELGVAIAQVANPLSTVLGGSSILDLMGTINELAQAGVQSAILGYLGNDAFPDLVNKAKAIGDAYADNDKQLQNVKRLIDGLKAGNNAQDDATTFLGLYNDYTPKVLLSDITLYGSKFGKVAEQLCEAAFAGGTAAAALLEIGIAASGECTEISAKIDQLITVYEELYDYQFDLMDSLSDAARAYLAYEKANEMKLIYTSGPRVDQDFLQKSAVNTFMASTMNIWAVLTEYCDQLTYTSGGAVPSKCATALNTPSHEAVINVLSYLPDPLCHTNNENTDFRDIPVQASGAGDTGYIDLNKLYKGETVKFKIPNYQWLRDNGWVGSQDTEKAMYIKRFELFLPPMSGTSEHTITLSVEPTTSNYLKVGGTKYQIPLTGYSASWTENSHNCYNDEIDNPYELCDTSPLVQLCVTSNGYRNRTVQPSVYNEWLVRATSIPLNQVAPEPKTNFKLQAGITMCVLNLAGKKKRYVQKRPTLVRNLRSTQHCCSSNEYWNGSECTTCPFGSSQQLSGYYCQ